MYTNEQIGLTINLPPKFKKPEVQRVISNHHQESEQKKSDENKNTSELDNNPQTITTFRDNADNLIIFIVKKSKIESNDLQMYLRDQQKLLLNSFKKEGLNIQYEDKTETEKIDFINFIKSTLTLTKDEKIFYVCIYTANIKDYETHIVALVNNNSEGKELLDAIKNSNFK